MRTIHKYEVKIDDHVQIKMPIGAIVRCVDRQRDRVCMWAEVETSMHEVTYNFRIFGTGHRIPEDFRGSYIGTVQLHNSLVFHIYQEH